ncbi:uncharacterized protein LOC110695150 [Chenopodium quinoa]|uniref:uncharacterized protein LOC110695150 n=1 Tax=Chenopodium quinoa TaxID=63459 RepID=UPI000B7741C0|nr:uncharacterized protein LOC110695150 [Chenopodium quinoa]
MDVEQEDFQSLGFFGILKKSLKTIVSWPKIFFQITLAFIFPQYCLFFANDGISKFLINKMIHESMINQDGSPSLSNVSNSTSSEWAIYSIINMVYVVLSVSLSLLTTSAVVYTVACIYTGKDFTFKKVVSVVPKIWKRLMMTFLCLFCIMFTYTFILSIVAIVFATLFYKAGIGMAIIGFIFATLAMVGLLFMVMIWQLANVISVLEKYYWFEALKKSRELIKGKMGTSFALLLVLNLLAMPFMVLLQKYYGFGIIERTCVGISIVVLGSLLTLNSLVAQTVFYFVCKSYHHESIDKFSLAKHLDEYLGEYVPLKDEAV